MKGQVIELLRENGIVSIDNELLENIKKHYHDGKRGIHIFEPPKIGSKILLLKHFVSTRDNINNRFVNETGFEREWTVYTVKEYRMVTEDYSSPNNQVILTYKVMKSPIRERRIEFRDFYCGYYYPKILTPEELENVKEYRELVDEKFDIRIV